MSAAVRPLGVILKDRWEATVAEARSYVAAWEAGAVSIRWRRVACQEVITLSREASAEDVIETALAMCLLGCDQPRRFRTERALRFELVRQVRRLGRMDSGRWKGKLVYRELPPRAIEAMAEMLVRAFATAGFQLDRLEAEEVERRRLETNELHSALNALSRPSDRISTDPGAAPV